MTTRDRLMIMGICTLAVLGAVWFMAVSPERKQAASLNTKVAAASAQLASAESELAHARNAQERYSTAYASIVSLGKAVPASQELPSLIYQLDQASNQKQVEFNSVVSGSGSGTGPGAPKSAGAATAASETSGGFTQMPFTFVFNGSFFDLDHLFGQLNQFTERTTAGQLRISGRLLTIQGVTLGPLSANGAEATTDKLTGTITATAYVLPASQGLTAGATPAGPAGAGSPAASPSSPTTPAVAKVTP
jgi:hypothetical protein